MEKKAIWTEMGLLHKGDQRDVLINNVRRALPRTIEKDFFENQICKEISGENEQLLKKYYILDSQLTKSECYVLNSVPIFMAEEEFEGSTTGLSRKDKEFLLPFYVNRDGGYILNTKYITENDESQIIWLLERKDLKIDDYTRTVLSGILEKYSSLDFPPYYYSNMYNDTKHYYFYQKGHEHIPGVMLIEVLRQMAYAYFYCYHGFVKGKLTISWESLDITFPNYAQSNYPVKVMLENVSEGPSTFEDVGVERLACKISMFQNFKAVGVGITKSPAIKLDVFKTIRTSGQDEEHFRFVPIKKFSKTVLLTDKENETRYECELLDVSSKGLGLKVKKTIENYSSHQIFSFSFNVDSIGDVYGDCSIKWPDGPEESDGGGYEIGVEIIDISEDCEYRLKEAIKLYTYIRGDREVF